MILTVQDLEKIRKYIVSTGIRDSELPSIEGKIPNSATSVVTIDNKEFKVRHSNSSSSTAVTNILVNHDDVNNSEDLVIERADGSRATIDSGLSLEEVEYILSNNTKFN